MAPTESSILKNFLLAAATFSSVISLEEFADLFPDTQQDSSEIEQLYRELQHQRAIDADDVNHNIELEAKRGEKMKRDVARARREENRDHSLDGLDARDIGMEIALFGTHDTTPKGRPHTLQTIQPAMANACKELEDEIAELEAEATSLLQDAKATVDDLNTLQHEQLIQSSDVSETLLGQEALQSLRRLQKVCRGVGHKT